MNDFSVIIPSKNIANLTLCIERINVLEPELKNRKIIIVNDELGKSGKYLCGRGHLVITGVKPFVFSRNINLGILSAGQDDVILLNDDALLETKGGFSKLREIAHQNQNYGLISPATSNVGNFNQNDRHTNQLRDESRTLCFVCIYLRREVIKKIGGLDERYLDYGMEDDDYCLSVRKAGLKLGIYDPVKVDHLTLPSSYRGRGGGDFSENMRRFIQKHGHDNWGEGRETSRFAHLFSSEKGTIA